MLQLHKLDRMHACMHPAAVSKTIFKLDRSNMVNKPVHTKI